MELVCDRSKIIYNTDTNKSAVSWQRATSLHGLIIMCETLVSWSKDGDVYTIMLYVSSDTKAMYYSQLSNCQVSPVIMATNSS